MTQPTAAIYAIGDELLAGDIADTNGPFLAEQLTDRGFRVEELRILPDNGKRITESVRSALKESDLTVLCGGLGPTSDDRTTAAVAEALGLERVLDEEHWQRIRELFSMLRGQEPPPGNEKQAMFPAGADVLPNLFGTAPGYALAVGPAALAVLPGPPRENRPMFEAALLPWIDRHLPGRRGWAVRRFRVFGLPESEVGHRLRRVESEFPELVVGYRFSFPEIIVKVRGEARTEDRLALASREVSRVLAPDVYSTGADRLPAVLGRRLEDLGLRIATAESCTGGLAAGLLTDEPGSSAWMERGFVTYTNESKEELLGVPAALLEEYGAVSEPVVRAMAAGALERSRADVAIAISGIAGPTGGTSEKPVGTVCIAWGNRAEQKSKTYHFHWDRDYNRIISAWAAMRQLLHFLGG